MDLPICSRAFCLIPSNCRAICSTKGFPIMKKLLKLFVSAVGSIMVLALVPVMAGAAPAATTPEESFAAHLQVVDAGLLSGGSDTSVLSVGVPTAADVGAALAAQAQKLAVYENAKAVGFGAWAARHGDTYKSVTSVPTARSVSVIGTRATIVEDVVTTLLWSSSATSNVTLDPRKALDVQKAALVGRAFGPGDIITSIVSTQHTVTLMLVNGSWDVVSDAYIDPFAGDLAADHVTSRSVGPAGSSQSSVASPTLPAAGLPSSKVSAPLVVASSVFSYNRGLAAAYADKYAKSYNPIYPDCNPSGGDCANFVSQALWDPNAANFPSEMPYWAYTGGSTCGSASTTAWRYTPSQHGFFVANPQGATYNFVSHEVSGSWSATNSYNISSMYIGDVVFYDWQSDGVIDHVAIAVGFSPDNSTLIDMHNTDSYHVRYDFGSSYNNGVTYYMDRFNDTVNIP